MKEINSHLIYGCKIWGQNQNNTLFERISNLQEKVFRIINFKRQDAPNNPLFKENEILKILKILSNMEMQSLLENVDD